MKRNRVSEKQIIEAFLKQEVVEGCVESDSFLRRELAKGYSKQQINYSMVQSPDMPWSEWQQFIKRSML